MIRKTYANALKVKPNEVNVSSVTCNNQPVKGAPAPPTVTLAPPATLPRPALRRTLLAHMSTLEAVSDALSDSQTDSAALSNPTVGRRTLQAGAPATLSTEFQVPGPADPAERAKLAQDIKESSKGLLTSPLSDFFGRDVTVSTPVQLSEPSKKPQVAAPTPEAVPRAPRALPPVPLPQPSPSPVPEAPTTELEEEVEAEVVPVEPVAPAPGAKPRPARSPVPKPQRPAPSPKPKANVTEEMEQETPTLPLQLPKMSPRPKINMTRVAPPPVNKTAAPPAPKVIVWSQAQTCNGKPDGKNSVPGMLMHPVVYQAVLQIRTGGQLGTTDLHSLNGYKHGDEACTDM